MTEFYSRIIKFYLRMKYFKDGTLKDYLKKTIQH